ncbi:hypothetical protein FACS1894211_01910 [Clostridia bacterium]|nr:hypothetical protein FACS1894211_01910 [Clostridia bacterium]
MNQKNKTYNALSGFYESHTDENLDFGKYFSDPRRIHFITPAHFHNLAEAVVIESGSYKALVNGEEKILTEGEALFVNPFEVHRLEALAPQTAIHVLQFGKQYTDKLYEICKKRIRPYAQSDVREKKDELLRYAKKICNGYADMNAMTLDGYINMALGLILDLHGLYEKETKSSILILNVLNYINEHCSEPLTLHGLSATFGYDKDYFSRMFNRYVGMNFREFLNRQRIEFINREIKSDKEKKRFLSEIAFKYGFSNMKTYYNAVKKIYR